MIVDDLDIVRIAVREPNADAPKPVIAAYYVIRSTLSVARGMILPMPLSLNY